MIGYGHQVRELFLATWPKVLKLANNSSNKNYMYHRFTNIVSRGLFVWVLLSMGNASRAQSPDFSTKEIVGRLSTNRLYTPVNQILTPAGLQIELPGLRPQALALSPEGKLLVTAGKTHELVVIAPETGQILQRVQLPAMKKGAAAPGPVSEQILKPDEKGQLSFTGLVFSPDGSRLYLANVEGDIKVFGIDAAGKVTGLFAISLPPVAARERKTDIPAGIAVSRDGKRLFVVLNLSNRLAELDAATGQVYRLWDIGVAPYDVVVTGEKIYVSNWGGRRPDAGSTTGPAGQGTLVRVDPIRYIANEGSVSVIPLIRLQKLPLVSIHVPWRCPRIAGGSWSPMPAATRFRSLTRARTRSSRLSGRAKIPRIFSAPNPMRSRSIDPGNDCSFATLPRTRLLLSISIPENRNCLASFRWGGFRGPLSTIPGATPSVWQTSKA